MTTQKKEDGENILLDMYQMFYDDCPAGFNLDDDTERLIKAAFCAGVAQATMLIARVFDDDLTTLAPAHRGQMVIDLIELVLKDIDDVALTEAGIVPGGDVH